MKKMNYSYRAAETSSPRSSEKSKNPVVAENKSRIQQPTEEILTRLNAIAREYPFCAIQKHRGSMLF